MKQKSAGKEPAKCCPLSLKAKLNELDTAWFKKVGKPDQNSKDSNYEDKFEAFGNIESITIERFYQDYIESNGAE